LFGAKVATNGAGATAPRFALGTCAGFNGFIGNAISQSVIISNAELPSYISYADAIAIISTGTGGVAGSTYLYHDQSTNSIGAVRL
jgi:hypothetical protein